MTTSDLFEEAPSGSLPPTDGAVAPEVWAKSALTALFAGRAAALKSLPDDQVRALAGAAWTYATHRTRASRASMTAGDSERALSGQHNVNDALATATSLLLSYRLNPADIPPSE